MIGFLGFLSSLIIVCIPLLFLIKDVYGYSIYYHINSYLRQFFIKEKTYCKNCKYIIHTKYKYDVKCGKATYKKTNDFYEPKIEEIYETPRIKNKYNSCVDYEPDV